MGIVKICIYGQMRWIRTNEKFKNKKTQFMYNPGYYEVYVWGWRIHAKATQKNDAKLWLGKRKLRQKVTCVTSERKMLILMIFIYAAEIIPRKCGEE